MSYNSKIGPLSYFEQVKPFPTLRSMKWRAEQILKKSRHENQWRMAAETLEHWISEYKESRLNEEMENFIYKRSRQLSEEGGWELAYLPHDIYHRDDPNHMATEADIRYLLENWPMGVDVQPDFPKEEDFEDLDVLQEILCSGHPYDNIDGFENATEAELYAVLALMKIEKAAYCLHIAPKKSDMEAMVSRGPHPWKMQKIIDAGNLLIEAMEIVSYADRELSRSQLRALKNEQQARFEIDLKNEARKETASKGGIASNQKLVAPRDFVKSEWAKHRNVYKNNKSAFARDYARRVLNEFSVQVTEKTIREVWLSNTPTTSKPAG